MRLKKDRKNVNNIYLQVIEKKMQIRQIGTFV